MGSTRQPSELTELPRRGETRAGQLQWHQCSPTLAPVSSSSCTVPESLTESLTQLLPPHPVLIPQHWAMFWIPDTAPELLNWKSTAGCWQLQGPPAFLLLKSRRVEMFQVWNWPGAGHGREGELAGTRQGQGWDGTGTGTGTGVPGHPGLQHSWKVFQDTSLHFCFSKLLMIVWSRAPSLYLIFCHFQTPKGKRFVPSQSWRAGIAAEENSSGPQKHRYQWILATENWTDGQILEMQGCLYTPGLKQMGWAVNNYCTKCLQI